MPHPDDGESRLTRRDFSRRAAAAAAGLLLAGATARSQDTGTNDAATTPQAPGKREAGPPATGGPPEAPAKAAPKTPPAPKGLAETVALVHMSAPGLPAKDSAELETQVKGVLDLQKDLRSHKVADGTEPDFVFFALTPGRTEGRRG